LAIAHRHTGTEPGRVTGHSFSSKVSVESGRTFCGSCWVGSDKFDPRLTIHQPRAERKSKVLLLSLKSRD